MNNFVRGYARLNAALLTSAAMILSVLVYQYYAFRGPSAASVQQDGLVYTDVQLFPQTMPVLQAGAYELVVTDLAGARHALGRFLIANQDTITDVNGVVNRNALFRLPSQVVGLARAELRLVERQANERPFSIEFLSGNFVRDRAFVEFGGLSRDMAGQYMLGTPTDGNDSLNERSGVYFGDYRNAMPGLRLAALKAGWVYEGWAVVNGQPLTTGRFRVANQRDQFFGFSATQAAIPALPGEDFLKDPPVLVFPGLTFPLDLAGDVIRIAIEPDVNGVDPTGQSPFGFTLLEAEIPRGADEHKLFDLRARFDDAPKATVVLR